MRRAGALRAQREGREVDQCLICTSITGATVEDCLAEVRSAAAQGVDIVELRLDFLASLQREEAGEGRAAVASLVAACGDAGLLCLVTFRPSWEGGQYEGAEAFRMETLREAAAAGADFIDLEYKLGAEAIQAFKADAVAAGRARIIVSDHNYEVTPAPEELAALVRGMKACGADIVKLATMANATGDAFRMLELARSESLDHGRPTIALAMGEQGLPSRLLAPKYGGFLTFGALAAGSESAPGQPSIADMTQVYRLKQQGSDTRVFGVIGDPIKHSMSPVIHNAAFEALGVDAVYLPFLVTDIEDFMDTFVAHKLAGCSITIPHKEHVAGYCADVDPVAQQIGAINTIVASASSSSGEDKALRASNTDWVAAISAIEAKLAAVDRGSGSGLEGQRVCILGSGGTARALAFGAISRGARVTIANRTLSKAQALAKELGCEAMSLEDLESSSEAAGSVLINTTSVGMSPNVDQAAVSQQVVARFALVFDAIYNPLRTKLLQMAEEEAKLTVSGVEMFIGQAAEQFKQFTGGRDPPLELMRDKVMERL